MDDTKLSKFLSFVLRHDPDSIDLTLDSEGWANIPMLIRKSREAGNVFSRGDLERVVTNNDKKRFTIQGEKIRAAQGHSVDVDLKLPEGNPPDVLFHGTATRFLESIYRDGLVSKSRQHVHLSSNEETAITVGARHGKPIVLKIDVAKMRTIGMQFYQSDNGVWLTNHVPADCISIG